jgi:hypothetical protein
MASMMQEVRNQETRFFDPIFPGIGSCTWQRSLKNKAFRTTSWSITTRIMGINAYFRRSNIMSPGGKVVAALRAPFPHAFVIGCPTYGRSVRAAKYNRKVYACACPVFSHGQLRLLFTARRVPSNTDAPRPWLAASAGTGIERHCCLPEFWRIQLPQLLHFVEATAWH